MIQPIRLLLTLITLLLATTWMPAFAGDDLDTDGGASVRKLTRHETLELPGLTACHQCEWRPSGHTMAAGERCGFDGSGKAKLAQFECGFSQDCKRVCNFLHCAEDTN